MSDIQPADIRAELPGDWWYFAGVLAASLNHDHFLDRRAPIWRGAPDRDGFHMTIYAGEGMGRLLADVYFRGKDGTTHVRVTTISAYQTEWQNRITYLHETAIQARDIRRMAIGHSPDELIETYYRSRAAGGKVTLKQLATQAGISYSYITKAKMAYDRAGKWGSGMKKELKDTT